VSQVSRTTGATVATLAVMSAAMVPAQASAPAHGLLCVSWCSTPGRTTLSGSKTTGRNRLIANAVLSRSEKRIAKVDCHYVRGTTWHHAVCWIADSRTGPGGAIRSVVVRFPKFGVRVSLRLATTAHGLAPR